MDSKESNSWNSFKVVVFGLFDSFSLLYNWFSVSCISIDEEVIMYRPQDYTVLKQSA